MLAKTLIVRMTAIEGDLYPKQDYNWVFESKDEAKGYMEFPAGVTIIEKGDSEDVEMYLICYCQGLMILIKFLKALLLWEMSFIIRNMETTMITIKRYIF